VLTRLARAVRQGDMKDDLRFREAKPITGGREQWSKQGLEYGASPAAQNNFQARYAIRHWWTGPMTCKNPQRGVWGGPPDGGQRQHDRSEQARVRAARQARARNGDQARSVGDRVQEVVVGRGRRRRRPRPAGRKFATPPGSKAMGFWLRRRRGRRAAAPRPRPARHAAEEVASCARRGSSRSCSPPAAAAREAAVRRRSDPTGAAPRLRPSAARGRRPPHFPSLVAIDRSTPRTPGENTDGEMLSDVDSCATCHADAAAHWSARARTRLPSFGNPIYRTNVEMMRHDLGNVTSQHCGGLSRHAADGRRPDDGEGAGAGRGSALRTPA